MRQYFIAFISLGLALSGMAFAKGRPSKEIVLDKPTQYGDYLIAAGTISVFSDEQGGFHSGTLSGKQQIFGVVFSDGTKITVSDEPSEGSIPVETIFESNTNLSVAGMKLGTWMSFLPDLAPGGEVVSVMTNLMQPAEIDGLQVAQHYYLRYVCSYTDCSTVEHLSDFVLAGNATLFGLDLPAGSRVEVRNVKTINAPYDLRIQGILVKGGKDAAGNAYEFSLDAFDRLLTFISAENTTIKGVPVQANTLVRLDPSGRPL